MHILDNWIEYPYPGIISQKINSKFLIHYYKKLLKLDPKLMVISKDLGNYLVKKYGIKKFYVYSNLASKDWFDLEIKIINTNKIKFLYYGGLHLDRDKSLEKFCNSLYLNKEIEVQLDIYTNQWNTGIVSSLKKYNFVDIFKPVDSRDLVKILSDYDAIIHVESDSKFAMQYSMYSLTTKTSEILASGKPTLIFGPIDNGTVRFFMANQFCVINTKFNVESIFNSIKSLYLLNYSDLKRQRDYSLNHFDLETISEKFHNDLIN
jgi:hypothetical protein